MMFSRIVHVAVICVSLVSQTRSEEFRVEKIGNETLVDISEAIRSRIGSNGYRVIRDSNRTVCEIWPCAEWEVQPGFAPTGELLYPFAPGQLIGVIRFSRRGSDFREQPLESGVYTLRYAHQPVDGNHLGTSPTRDFLLLVQAENDSSPDRMDVKELMAASAKAAQSSHPAMLCLQRIESDSERPLINHNEEHDWRILGFQGKAKADGKLSDLPVDLIVVGHASE